ncbi:hypothetical protein FDECE_12563 [Fusarium decemcellulare]|nr:hypothetical protein FDECE_12563 [Fusarium decemcellulare]
MAIQWTEESVFGSYNIFEETYKTVSSHDIKAAVLIPKNLKPGLHPVIYHLHGGFLVTAHGLFAPFFPKWADKLAREHSAIIISPDYRLLPSANGVQDLLEDVEDCWQWTKAKLPEILKTKAPGHSLDFSQVLLAGGSAGGYCSVQLALSHPEAFQALAIIYPLIDAKDRLYLEGPRPGEHNVLRFPDEEIPSKEDALVWIEEKRKTPESKDGFERSPWAVSACQNGLFMSHIFDNKNLNKREFFPLERIEAGDSLPTKIWLMHGDDDSTVPIRGSDKFVNLVREKLPQTEVRYDVVPGQDHAFDFDEKTWESFADDALEFVTQAWLAKA